MTVMRSILLACSSAVLFGCFDDPPPIVDPSTTGTAGDTTAATTLGMTTALPTTTTETTATTTVDPTTVDSTTVGPLDTTAESTTSEGSATDSTSSSSTTGDPCVPACAGLVCGPIDACECGECGPMATCSTDQSYCGVPVGHPNDFGDVADLNPQLQFGHRFTVFAPTTVRRLGVISAGAGPQVRLALYDHDGAGPANRLVQTGAVPLFANGVNEFDVGATPIAAGDYWVMMHTDVSTFVTRTFDGMTNYELALRSGIPFASGLPMTMNDEMVIDDYGYNLYMVVEE
jgi:hypothetical protein